MTIQKTHNMLKKHIQNVNATTTYRTDISDLETYKTRDGRDAGKCFFEDGGDAGAMLYAFLNENGFVCEYGDHDFHWKATSESGAVSISYIEGDIIIAQTTTNIKRKVEIYTLTKQTMIRIQMVQGKKYYEVLSRESVMDSWLAHDLHNKLADAITQRDAIQAGFIKS